jgi:hypothetical protein
MMRKMTSTAERIGRLDIAIAVVLSLLAIADMISQVVDDEINASVAAVPLFLALTVPLLWRRAAPVGALLAVNAGLLVHVALFGTSGVVRCGILLPAAFLLAYSAAVRQARTRALLALGLALGAVTIVCLTDGETGADAGALWFVLPLTLAVWGVGRVVRSRTRMVEELESRTVALHEARDERARMEVATDRARMATELDELLQRRLGELALLADSGAAAADPATAAVALADIERESRRTLDEMRAVVGVLRGNDGEAPLAPQPALTHLEAMLIRAKGADARLTVEGSPRALPAGVELSAYRIVEHLLGALDDAPDVKVTVRFGDDSLELAVAGRARRRGEEAIERARERAKLHQGTVRATVHQGRAEALVSLPVLAAV